MKAFKKSIICLLVILALVFGFSFACLAEEDGLLAADITNDEAQGSDTGINNDTDTPPLDIADDNIEDADTEAESDDDNASDNPFALFFATVSEYSAELLSALAFIGSLILAFCYKKGLLPLVESALTAIAKAVGSIREKADATETVSRELTDTLTKRLEAAEGVIEQLGTAISSTSAALDAYQRTTGERAAMRLVLGAQIDMLYDIFMTSSLPQYQKDAVGERICKMKEALSAYEREAV